MLRIFCKKLYIKSPGSFESGLYDLFGASAQSVFKIVNIILLFTFRFVGAFVVGRHGFYFRFFGFRRLFIRILGRFVQSFRCFFIIRGVGVFRCRFCVFSRLFRLSGSCCFRFRRIFRFYDFRNFGFFNFGCVGNVVKILSIVKALKGIVRLICGFGFFAVISR